MPLGHPVHRFEKVTSTNEIALALFHQGASEGTLVVADAQTRGRGRLGRTWVSPSGVNLYCSYILRSGNVEWVSWVPLIASLAVACAIYAETKVDTKIKWPNDLLINGKKVAGVLAETISGNGTIQSVVLGIGINVNMDKEALPSSLHPTTTSLFEHVDYFIDRDKLLESLTVALGTQYQNFWADGPSVVMSDYLRLSDTVGKRVVAYLPAGRLVEGWADGIELDGSLRLRRAQGDMLIIRSADILHLR